MIKNTILSLIGIININTIQAQLPFQLPTGTYNITNEISVDFVLSHEGVTPYTTENNIEPLKFSNAFEPEFIINTYDNITDCRYNCAYDTNCLGLVEYRTNTTNTYCNTLSNLGYTTETESYSYSYKKITLHRYHHDTNNVFGQVLNVDNTPEYIDYNYQVYIDQNHNGEYDIGEPYNYTNNDGDFEFNNLRPGVYFFRMILPDACIQYIPSIFGTGQYYYGTGYADIVLEYYKDGHYSLQNIPGGIIDSTSDVVDIDYILGNNQSTYLSFFNNYSITLGLIDETIHDTEGDDIFFTIYNSNLTDIQAHVSISTYDTNYHYLGVLNNNQTSFDLSDINYTIPIDHIHLHFFGNNSNGPLNIVSVRGQINTSYYPAYANQWEVPTVDNMIFIIDCNYQLSCSTFCAFHLFHDYEYFSCLNSCQKFDNSNQCYCNDQENNFYQLTEQEYDPESCERGCEYVLNSYVYPDFRAIRNSEGFNEDIITTLECNNCLDLLIDTCQSIRECRGFDFNDNSIHHIYRKYNFVYDNSSFFILKNNNESRDIGYMTTTTTLTTSPTSTQTSTITSSLTSTQTTTQTTTSTATSTATSTVTSTVTSTATSTQTTTNNVASTINNTGLLSGAEVSLIVICLLFVGFVLIMYVNKSRRKQQENITSNNGHNNYNASFQHEVLDQGLHYTSSDSHYKDIPAFYTDSPIQSPTVLPEVNNGYMDVSRRSQSSLGSPKTPVSPNRVSVL